MKILFRVDASPAIGSGHLIRCLALAEALRKLGAKISFVCENLPSHYANELEKRSYLIYDNSKKLRFEQYDWLVIDHYEIDMVGEKSMASLANKIFVIDDLANRKHSCDLLLDQNYYEDGARRYESLLDKTTRTLLGPQFALLRSEFGEARLQLTSGHRIREGASKNILVFLGGADFTAETPKVIKALKKMENIQVDVVLGAMNSAGELVKSLVVKDHRFSVHENLLSMAQLILKADFAIGAGGTSLLERCFLGLPSAVIQVAANQIEVTKAFAEKGLVFDLGWHSLVTEASLSSFLNEFLPNKKALSEMSKKSLTFMGPEIGTEKVARALMGGQAC